MSSDFMNGRKFSGGLLGEEESRLDGEFGRMLEEHF